MQPNSQTYRLGFIGAGKLAGSVIRGLLRQKFCLPNEIVASEPNDSARAALAETGIDFADNNQLVRQSEIVFLGVKPPVVLPIIRELAAQLETKLVVSLAAGIRTAEVESLADARFMRAMTNTPSAIGRGATALARGSRITDNDLERVAEVFRAIGHVEIVTEKQIDAVTALSGSGPAFVYSVIEALAKGGEKTGLPNDVALALATHTVLGAAQLAAETKLSPEELRQMVITPGGTTAAGLAAMKKFGAEKSLVAAVEAANARAQEMARQSGK